MQTNIIKGRSPAPSRILIYGPEGIGKSSIAAQAPAAIFLPTEDGLNQIDCSRFPLITSWSAMLSALDELVAGGHDYRTVVIDSLDWLEKLIWEHVCDHYAAESIEQVLGGYGKGYTVALNEWAKVIEKLDTLRSKGMSVILVAHHKIEKWEEPGESSYDRYSPRLNKHATAYVTEWVDAVLFLHLQTMSPKTEDQGFNRKRSVVNKMAVKRVIECHPGPAWVAKNRFNMPGQIDMTWAAIVAAIANGR